MFLAVLSNYFAFEKNYHYYPQVFSKKCKNIEKKKVIWHITGDLEIFTDDSDKECIKIKNPIRSFFNKVM